MQDKNLLPDQGWESGLNNAKMTFLFLEFITADLKTEKYRSIKKFCAK